ncbi:hypothetical protein E2562_001056 [Oryza meyeriana var. granulata]|uniref:Uncharacterized protein n=1 Tax=Oryza meyeriana var. granulata TaxID=110450 RepID=A0A6G1ECZ7_9ORYZ|nr:hypothetical protein E2562_001056 [Oryza meyeriana var. granulata]
MCSWGGLRKLTAPMYRRYTSSGVDLAVGPSTVPAKDSHGYGICARRRAARSCQSGDKMTAAHSRALPSSANGEAKQRSGRQDGGGSRQRDAGWRRRPAGSKED